MMVDFQVPPSEAGWYGMIRMASYGNARKVPVYWTGQEWRDHPEPVLFPNESPCRPATRY
jgi:hypothetical protein